MTTFRHAVRALIVDESDHVLLCRFDLVDTAGKVILAAPGGGIEPGESLLAALTRELREEIGLELDGLDPRHLWNQQVEDPRYAPGFDGVINDHFVLKVRRFEARGAMTDEELAAENVTEFRWWSLKELEEYDGEALFSPRALPRLYRDYLEQGVPAEPRRLGV
ncbi:NUDIX domain-containing protein [Kribbella deserti]|uniref:NUDIX domain-containing protein n=1 Tax=Kribbella deserti TaxID=1926257 RepID=A0ABV6QD71_9ACTN